MMYYILLLWKFFSWTKFIYWIIKTNFFVDIYFWVWSCVPSQSVNQPIQFVELGFIYKKNKKSYVTHLCKNNIKLSFMNTYFIVLIDILMLQKLALFPKLGNFLVKVLYTDLKWRKWIRIRKFLVTEFELPKNMDIVEELNYFFTKLKSGLVLILVTWIHIFVNQVNKC